MDDLRSGLGLHHLRTGPIPELGLDLHDLCELLRRAGRSAGLKVQSEFKVSQKLDGEVVTRQSEARRLRRLAQRIDLVWLSPDSEKPIVAIEIEGQGVNPRSVAEDVAKFRACGALLNLIALFQVDHDGSLKGRPPRGIAPRDWVRQNAGEFAMEVLLDEELMKTGGAEALQRRALDLMQRDAPSKP